MYWFSRKGNFNFSQNGNTTLESLESHFDKTFLKVWDDSFTQKLSNISSHRVHNDSSSLHHRYYPNSKISIHLKFPSCLVKLSVERENIFSYVSSIPTCPTLMSDAFEVWLLDSKLWPYCTFLFRVALTCTFHGFGYRKPKTTQAIWEDFLIHMALTMPFFNNKNSFYTSCGICQTLSIT